MTTYEVIFKPLGRISQGLPEHGGVSVENGRNHPALGKNFAKILERVITGKFNNNAYQEFTKF
jgi:hypothetical protein